MKKVDLKKDNFTKRLRIGLSLSFERMVEVKKLTNSKLAFSENGKIVKINARDIKLK